MSEYKINKLEQEIDSLILEEKLALLERIIHKLKVDALKHNNNSFDITKYRGIYKDLDVNIEQSLKEMRDEWERDIL